MSRSRRFWPLLVVVVSLVGLLGTALPASAHISAVTVDPTGEIGPGEKVTVHGTITCDDPERWNLRVRVTQSLGEITLYKGTDRDRGDCSGEPDPWTAIIRRQHRGTPSPGPAEVCWVAKTVDDRDHGCSMVVLA
jgi:hypothetical protein